MKRIPVILLITISFMLSTKVKSQEDPLMEKAKQLAQEILIIDTHIDVPERLQHKWEDISGKTESGNFDFVRAKEGGLNAPFMAIFVGANYMNNGAKAQADTLLDLMWNIVKEHPDKFVVPLKSEDVMRIFKSGKMAMAFGMENGSALEGDLKNVKYFYDRGIRYITLCHSKVNEISDSSFDPERKWYGLSPFGKSLIAEMNRVGMMVDISHVSDDAFYQAVELSKVPCVATHSSCRYFTPGYERNCSDDMIEKLAAKGGLIQINFGSDFLNQDYKDRRAAAMDKVTAYLKEHNLKRGDREAWDYVQKYFKENPIGFADVTDVVKHIDHVVKLVGIDHVGIGSDFDGVGDTLPTGLKDVSGYPNIIYHLLKAGYSREDIQKIFGGNLLRVWLAVEKYTADHVE